MNSEIENKRSWGFQEYLGVLFIVIALCGVYWIFMAVISLWNAPETVPFISFFINQLETNSISIISGPGGDINWPEKWQVIVGVFLTIVLISSIGILTKTFLVAGLCLLFPKIHFYGGLMETLIYRVRGKGK